MTTITRTSSDRSVRRRWTALRKRTRGRTARSNGFPRRGARGDWRDVFEGIAGISVMAGALATPCLRGRRSHWGLDDTQTERPFPGDRLVPSPRWSFTHAIEIDATPDAVWPWVAQIGADRGGFYSYQWLENLAGCRLRNAEEIRPEWEVREGDAVSLHPNMPPLGVASIERGRYFVIHGPADAAARAAGKPWIVASWLFLVE